jgi:hypothetical protein
MSMKLINHNILNTVFSYLKKNFFKSIKHGLRNKFLIERIIQNGIFEIDYITKGKNEIILWYKNYDTKDRQYITLTVKEKDKLSNRQEDTIDIKTILQFGEIFIISTSNHLLKTDLKALSFLQTYEDGLDIKKTGQTNYLLLTNKEIFLMNKPTDLEADLVIARFKNPLNKIENIFIVNCENCNYVLKNSKNAYSLVNVNNCSDTKALKLKGFEFKTLLNVMETGYGFHLFIFETFIAKYDIGRNEYLDLYTTKSKILGYFLNGENLVFICKRVSDTYLLNTKTFAVEKRLIFTNEFDFSKFVLGYDFIIHETEDVFYIYHKHDYSKKKVISKLYVHNWAELFESFNYGNNIVTIRKRIRGQKIECHSYSIRKENIKLSLPELGDNSQFKSLSYINNNLLAICFNNKFIIYNYKQNRLFKIFNTSNLFYVGKYTNHKILYYNQHDLYIYDLVRGSTYRMDFREVYVDEFCTDHSKYLVTNKQFIYSDADELHINNIKRREHYHLNAGGEITGLYKHYYNNEIIVVYDNGFNIYSLKEKKFIGDRVVLSLTDVKYLCAKVNSRNIILLADSGRFVIYNFKNGHIDYRELRKAYEDIVCLSEKKIILFCKQICDEYLLDNFTRLSKIYA